MLRGILGRALRRTGCTTPDHPCPAACLTPAACTYSALFDPPLPSPLPHRLLGGSTHAPQPLIPLFPPPGARDLAEGEPFSFTLRILGPLRPQPADRLRAALEAYPAFPIGKDLEGRLVLDEIVQKLPAERPLALTPGAPGEGRLTVESETPIWLPAHGKLTAPDHVDFPGLFRHAYRRLTTLAALYGEVTPEDDALFHTLLPVAAKVTTTARALRILRWERLSEERGERHPMMGLDGRVAFAGPVGPFVPFFRAMELTHLGKAVSHGLGRVRVESVVEG
ncbi:MAG: CRISPR system precrRNA processing endoribonuclease RAMP protein Cas6 [Byssovorax sp.]